MLYIHVPQKVENAVFHLLIITGQKCLLAASQPENDIILNIGLTLRVIESQLFGENFQLQLFPI